MKLAEGTRKVRGVHQSRTGEPSPIGQPPLYYSAPQTRVSGVKASIAIGHGDMGLSTGYGSVGTDEEC